MATATGDSAPPPPAPHPTKLTQARAGLAYLVNPQTHPAPGSLVTRSSLKSLRYVLKFVFWRLVRYAVSCLQIIARGGGAFLSAFLSIRLLTSLWPPLTLRERNTPWSAPAQRRSPVPCSVQLSPGSGP